MSTDPKHLRRPKLPSWQRAPFDRFVAYTRQGHRLVQLTIHGIHVLTEHDRLVEALQKYDDVRGEGRSEQDKIAELQEAHAEAELARAEVESDFPKLRAHAVVDQWGALEVLIEDVVVAWLMQDPKLLVNSEIAHVRLPLAEFLQLDGEERYRFLVQEIARDRKADLKGGVNRFEVMLAVMGLDGAVNASLKRDIWEIHQIRNSIVHRAGLADRRLLAACPWISLNIGDPIALDYATHGRYEVAIINYAFVVLNRLLSRAGLPLISVSNYEADPPDSLQEHAEVRLPETNRRLEDVE